jgi:hypothetical protein
MTAGSYTVLLLLLCQFYFPSSPAFLPMGEGEGEEVNKIKSDKVVLFSFINTNTVKLRYHNC